MAARGWMQMHDTAKSHNHLLYREITGVVFERWLLGIKYSPPQIANLIDLRFYPI
jgi:hypothetical protein